MNAKDEKIDELIKLLGFDKGLGNAVRKAHSESSIEEIQEKIDRARDIRNKISKLSPNGPTMFDGIL